MLRAQQQLETQLKRYGPQDDDELYAWIKSELGIDIPRAAVCPDHVAPFTFLSDLYFERVEAALGVANRGGMKTLSVAILHWVNAVFKPGIESCTFGAIEAQSFRAYSHLRNWIYDENGNYKPEVKSSLMKETLFRNGSKIEVLGSTAAAVNGPHPQVAHADEIELMAEDTWSESRNMTLGKKLRDGRQSKPLDVATSTRKGPSGRVQALIDEITDAVSNGYLPPRKLYMWCAKETAQERPDCRRVAPEMREARLLELARKGKENPITKQCYKLDDICECHLINKGEWDNGKPRLLSDICGGDFFRSRGWQPPADVYKQFRENDRETYEAQVLCERPEMKWHYLHNFSEQKHGIRSFKPDPNNGPIFQGIDWGGTNPHAVHWYQLLRNEIEADQWMYGDDGEPVKTRIKEGTLVCFDEIYIAEIGNEQLGQLVKKREAEYIKEFGPTWRVYERFADPQGKGAKLDWKAMGLRTHWHVTREKEEQIKAIRSMMEDDLFRILPHKCPMWVREAKDWRMDPNSMDELDENFNHAMSAFRYVVINVKKIRNKALQVHGGMMPNARSYKRRAPGVTIKDSRRPQGPVKASRNTPYENWRKSLGGPEPDRPIW